MSAITSVETVLASVFAEYVAVSGLPCDASVAVKDVVRSDGSVLKPALADGITNSGAIGMCVAKEVWISSAHQPWHQVLTQKSWS